MPPATASRNLPSAMTRPPCACTSFADRREYARYSSRFATLNRLSAYTGRTSKPPAVKSLVGQPKLWAWRQAFKGGHAIRNKMERLTFCREDRLLRAAID